MQGELNICLRKRLEELCRERNLNVYDLADSCGVASYTIQKLFQGKTQRLGVGTVKKLCKGLSITLAEFYDCKL